LDDREFTPAEVKNAIADLKDKKAPGDDGITGVIHQRIYKLFPTLTYTLYCECLRTGGFPKRWKKAKIIPITKPGKEKLNDASKFRPISLINVGGKVLEKLLINRIMHDIYSNNLLNTNQYGFTPKKSTTDATLAVKEYIEDGFRQGHITILVSIDVRSAFDAAWWPSILHTLKEFNCPKNLYKLARSYFSNRTATIYTNNIQIERDVSKGCPQGSCCGPGFWNIQFNSLLNLKYRKRTKVIAFADDLLIAVRAENVQEAENYANIDIGKISNWAQENKITFKEQKSKVMLLTLRKRKENTEVNIYLNTKILEQVNSIKYLGIIIDSKMHFREHIISTAKKCTTLIHTLAKSAKLNWGLKQEALNTIYKGAILPLMLYGAPVWIRAMEKNCNRTLYNRVQRLINIKIAKAYRTTSNDALCLITGNTPIEMKAEEAANLYRITKDKQNQLLDHETEQQDWTHPADTVRIDDQNELTDHSVHIHTDGSKHHHGVGSGIAIYIKSELTYQIKHKLHNRC
jgi:hypothetical protein